MDVTMLLCDYADTANGKLTMVGAGWSILAANTPAPVALGILITVPWDQTNIKHTFELALVDEDGHRVSLGDPPQEVVLAGQFEAGRPPGMPAGTPQVNPVPARIPALPLPPGGYSFILSLNGEESARASFRTIVRQQ